MRCRWNRHQDHPGFAHTKAEAIPSDPVNATVPKGKELNDSMGEPDTFQSARERWLAGLRGF
jgi:hypothetical protein